jgi:hypothetical protein
VEELLDLHQEPCASLPARTHVALVPEDCWKYEVPEEDMAQVWGPLQKI